MLHEYAGSACCSITMLLLALALGAQIAQAADRGDAPVSRLASGTMVLRYEPAVQRIVLTALGNPGNHAALQLPKGARVVAEDRTFSIALPDGHSLDLTLPRDGSFLLLKPGCINKVFCLFSSLIKGHYKESIYLLSKLDTRYLNN